MRTFVTRARVAAFRVQPLERGDVSFRGRPLLLSGPRPPQGSSPRCDAKHLQDAWMKAALRGDRDGLTQLVDQCSIVPRLLRARLARAGTRLSSADFEDLEQETLTAVWKNLPSFQGHSAFRSWLYGICTKQVYQCLAKRERGRRSEPLDSAREPEIPEARELPGGVDSEHLAQVLSEVQPPASRILELRFLDGESLEDIARELELPLGTVKTHLYRTLRKLRARLERPELRAGTGPQTGEVQP